MTDRPATDPRTEAGRTAMRDVDDGRKPESRQYWLSTILAIEAEAAQGAAPRAEGLDPELAEIYLAAAMKECGYTATEADARSILDYLDGDNGVRLAPQERRD